MGVIHFDHDLPGFMGELPVVSRKLAESWLSIYKSTAGPGRPVLSHDAAEAYRKLYPNGHKADGLSWKEVARSVGESLGHTVSIKTIKRGLEPEKQAKTPEKMY